MVSTITESGSSQCNHYDYLNDKHFLVLFHVNTRLLSLGSELGTFYVHFVTQRKYRPLAKVSICRSDYYHVKTSLVCCVFDDCISFGCVWTFCQRTAVVRHHGYCSRSSPTHPSPSGHNAGGTATEVI